MDKTSEKERLTLARKMKLLFLKIPTWFYVAIAISIAISYPLFVEYGLSGKLWLRLAVRTEIFVLLALGLNLIIGDTGLLNLGYAAFFAVGAYLTAILASPRFGFHLPFLVLFLASGALAGFFGFLVGLPTLKLRGDYLAIVTLALGESTRLTLNNWDYLTNGPGGIPAIYHPTLFGYSIDSYIQFYYLTLIIILISIVVLKNLKNSKLGRALNAMRENEIAAECMGVDITKTKIFSFVISSIFAGFAGSIFASFQTFINPNNFVFMTSTMIVCMIVLGGMGSLPGVIAGAIILDTLPEIIRQIFSVWLPSIFGSDFYANWPYILKDLFINFDRYRMLFFGILIVIMMLFKPEGIIPNRRRQKELHEIDPREISESEKTLFDVEEGKMDIKA